MALFQYPNSKNWWYDFQFAGQRIRESTKTKSKRLAIDAERARRRELELSYNGVRKREKAKLFSVAAEAWLDSKTFTLAASSIRIERDNLKHVLPRLGRFLVSDIQACDISRYQRTRLAEGAAPKTVNLEVGTIRAILRRHGTWSGIQADIRMLPVQDDVGRALTEVEEAKLLAECRASRSRALYPAVVLALSTAMRYSEIRLLTWAQVNISGATISVGQSKTIYGTGRVIPLNSRAVGALAALARQFPERHLSHYVFPAERYGAAGDNFDRCAYHTNPMQPIGDWKEAWEAAKRRSNIKCRFHDLRHTACTRMLEGGIPYPVVASIMGWSAATAIRMSKRYGHIGQKAYRQAVDLLEGPPNGSVEQMAVRNSGSIQ